MALDDAYQKQIDLAAQNRAQLPPVASVTPTAGRSETLQSPSPGEWQHWYEFGAIWLVLLVVGLAVAFATRKQPHRGLRWLRRGLLAWVAICAFGALASVHRADPAYATWIAVSAWPPILFLALLAAFSFWRRRAD